MGLGHFFSPLLVVFWGEGEASLSCSHTQNMDVDKVSDQNFDLNLLDISAWMLKRGLGHM